MKPRASRLLPVVLCFTLAAPLASASSVRLVLRDAYLDPARQAAFTPDGRSLNVWTTAGAVVWDLEAGLPRAGAMPSVDPPVAGRTFSPDGRWLAHVMPDGKVELRDIRTFSVDHELEGHPGGTGALALDGDGKWLATGGADGRIRIWSVSDGSLVRTLTHGAAVSALVFPGGAGQLVSASTNGVLRVWDARTWEVTGNLAEPGGGALAMAPGPRGRGFVTVSTDGGVRLWGGSPSRELATLAMTKRGSGWLVVTPSGWFDGTPEALSRLADWERNGEAARLGWLSAAYLRPGALAEVTAGILPDPRVPIAEADLHSPWVDFYSVEVAEGDDGATGARSARVMLEVGQATGSGVREVRLFRDGALVNVWNRPVAHGGRETMFLQTEVLIPQDEAYLSAYALGVDGVRGEVVTEALAGPTPAPRAHVLAVGVSAHESSALNLAHAAREAGVFGEALRDSLVHTRRFEEVRLTTLLNRDATRDGILDALRTLAERSAAQDAVFVFFAGNALSDANRFALVPSDARHSGGRQGVGRGGVDNLFARGVDQRALTEALQAIGSRWLVLVIDASNAVNSADSTVRAATLVASPPLARIAEDAGVQILVSGFDVGPGGVGPATSSGALVNTMIDRGLASSAADGPPSNGMIELSEWLAWSREEVSRTSAIEPRLYLPIHPDRLWPLVVARPTEQ